MLGSQVGVALLGLCNDSVRVSEAASYPAQGWLSADFKREKTKCLDPTGPEALISHMELLYYT